MEEAQTLSAQQNPECEISKRLNKLCGELMAQRVLVLDGAMGTMLQQRDLSAIDFGGVALEGCNEVSVRTRPDVVLDIHRKYFAAGADIVETNTFGGRRWCWGVCAFDGGTRAEQESGGTSAAGGRRICKAGATAVCCGIDGADHESDHRDGRRDV